MSVEASHYRPALRGKNRTLIMKFDGNSVADIEQIRGVAQQLVAAHRAGYRVVGVLSAMGDTTEALVRLAYEVSSRPTPREHDMLISAGEQISVALCAMAVHDLAAKAVSLTGSQAGIVTDDDHGRAKITEIRAQRIHRALESGTIVLVGGSQGASMSDEVTSLGQGGSDVTAFALASALGADNCEILHDGRRLERGSVAREKRPETSSSATERGRQSSSRLASDAFETVAVPEPTPS